MKQTIALLTITAIGITICLAGNGHGRNKHQKASESRSVQGIIVHLPSDGAFQFYVFKECGLDVTTGNYTNQVVWNHEIWPVGCWDTPYACADYAYNVWYPYPVQWQMNSVQWIADFATIVRDFQFISPNGFWQSPSYNFASLFDLCGNYLGEFLPQLNSVGYPLPGEYWIDFALLGAIRVSSGGQPPDFDAYLIDGSQNPSPRTVLTPLVEDASSLPMFCP